MYIGIDLGTSAVKLLLCDKEGKVISEVSREYEMAMPKSNWAEQNPEDWWNQTKEGLKEISKTYTDSIKGISFSGQMHGLVVLDEYDQVIRPAILWCDQRTQKECDEINAMGIEKLVSLVGNQALTGFTAPKLLWMYKHEPENFKRIKKIMLPKDYVQYKLTGIFASDVSDASGTLLFDVKQKRWSKEMMEFLHIQTEQLPSLFESYQKTGIVRETILEEIGLSGSIVVAAGGGDQAVGAVGVGVVEEGVMSVALGTSGVVFLPCEKYSADASARLHSFAHANGKYHQMGVVLSAAGALKWWIEKINETKDYQEEIEVKAQKAKANGLYFLPYLIGERTPINDANARGCFVGLNLTHSKADMNRAVLEGITFALRQSYEIIKELGQPTHEIFISGGGSNSLFWKQMIADVFQLPVTAIETAQGPAFGACILAHTAVSGKKIEEVCRTWIKKSHTFSPSIENKEMYDCKYNKYASLYPLMKDVFEMISD